MNANNAERTSFIECIHKIFIILLTAWSVYAEIGDQTDPEPKCGIIPPPDLTNYPGHPQGCQGVIDWILGAYHEFEFPGELIADFEKYTGVDIYNGKATQNDVIMYLVCSEMEAFIFPPGKELCWDGNVRLTMTCEDVNRSRQCLKIPDIPKETFNIHAATIPHIGFATSTGSMNPPAPVTFFSKITDIAKNMGAVRNYKFYGHDQSNDIKIANAIFAGNKNAKFMISIAPEQVDNLNETGIDEILKKWDSLKNNINWIALGNEPLQTQNGITWASLPKQFTLLSHYLKNKEGWKTVQATIPFTPSISSNTGQKEESAAITSECEEAIKEILKTMRQYKGVFSFQPYPFPEPKCCSDLKQSCIGNEKKAGDGHTMVEAQYASMRYALNKLGDYDDIELMITETGWSTHAINTDCNNEENANWYIRHTLMSMQTPTSPLFNKTVFFFELFDEKGKGNEQDDPEMEKNFGLYQQNGESKDGMTVTADLFKSVPKPLPAANSLRTQSSLPNAVDSSSNVRYLIASLFISIGALMMAHIR